MRIAAIPLHIHWSFWLVLLYLGASGSWQSGDPLFSMSLFALLMVIVTLHEFGHSFAARALGIRVDKISITGIGGIAELGDFLDSKKEFLVTLAGPAVNLAIALVLWPLVSFESGSRSLLDSLWLLNLVVLIFNLIPMYPMDGGRLSRIGLSLVFGELRSYTVSKYINLALLGLAIVVCLQYHQHIMLIILGFMGLYGVTTCRNMEEIIEHQIKSEAELKELFSRVLQHSPRLWQQGKGNLTQHDYEYELFSSGQSISIKMLDLPAKKNHPPVTCTFAKESNTVSWAPRYVVYFYYLQVCLNILRAQLPSNYPTTQKA
jgi:Zn-dependent protease